MTDDVTSKQVSLLHQVFERQAGRTPEATAVEDIEGSGRFSYGELDLRADRLAAALQERGVAPGSIVGIFLPRCIEQYTCMLAILKAGGAYLPIDPEVPTERAAYMLKDAGADLVLISAEMWRPNMAKACTPVFLESIPLDDWSEYRDPSLIPVASLTDEDLCYIIYTSGTTGDPKGICISHRNVMTFVKGMKEVYGVRRDDRVLQGFSTAFDASVEEIWLAFSSGATLVAVSAECMHDVEELPERLREYAISVFSTVPTILEVMPEADLPNLRLLISGGEAAHGDLVEKWFRPGRTILNTYGPTECSVVATSAECVPGKDVTIGRPLPGYQALVLDEHLNEVPRGAKGELCIGGPAVSSRGYLNRPELTEGKFVVRKGHRLCRTGDLVCLNDDGNLVYGGRIDSQVKLRGFRVELEEVEANLCRLHGVEGAIAAVQRDELGTPLLVAFIIQEELGGFDVRRAVSWLKSRLPEYMIPTHFVSLNPSAVPRMTSGKIDRNALPVFMESYLLSDTSAEEEVRAETDQDAHCAPLERKLLAVLRDVLQRQVQCGDSFFDLGGHSVLAAQVISLCRQDPELSPLGIRDLYECETVRSLAARLEELNARRRPEPSELEGEKAKPRTSGGNREGPRVSAAVYRLVASLQILVLLVLTAAGSYILYGVLYGAYLLQVRLSAETLYWAWIILLLLVVVVPIVSLAVTIIAGLFFKWVVFGRFREQDIPVWSLGYFRWWLANICLTPIRALAGLFVGTPLAPFLYRLLGARIGSAVYMGSALPEADLITIEDGASVGARVMFRTHFVERGCLKLRRIHIGKNVFIGAQSIVGGGVMMGDGSRLHPLSCLVQGTTTQPGSEWRGSPAREVRGRRTALSMMLDRHEKDSGKADSWTTWKGCAWTAALQLFFLYVFGLAFLIPLVFQIFLMSGFSTLLTAVFSLDLKILIPASSLFSAVRFAGTLTIIVTLKWLLTGRIHLGTISLNCLEYVRRWFAQRLVGLLVDPRGTRGITETLFMPGICRLLGMRVGKGTEISDAVGFQPDLVILGDYSMLADRCVLGVPVVHGGRMTLGTTLIGHRAFVANVAHVPVTAAGLNNGCLVGVLSLAPDRMEPGSSWLGSPSVRFPRQSGSSAPASRTTHPPRYMVAARAFWNIWKMILPGALVEMLFWVTAYFGVGAFMTLSRPVFLAVLPLLMIASTLTLLLLPVVAKWLLIGKYRAGDHFLWCFWMWRMEIAYEIELLVMSFFRPLLNATALGPMWYRAMGARIGKRACFIGGSIMEADLVRIGDNVTLEGFLQTHLFEDRVMRLGRITLKDDCAVGSEACVLYDSEMGENSSLGDLSLIMKHERFLENASYHGLPAQRVD